MSFVKVFFKELMRGHRCPHCGENLKNPSWLADGFFECYHCQGKMIKRIDWRVFVVLSVMLIAILFLLQWSLKSFFTVGTGDFLVVGLAAIACAAMSAYRYFKPPE